MIKILTVEYLASRSDYDYHLNRSGKLPVIVIEDKNTGRMSVTNNIDAVVATVIRRLGLCLSDMNSKYLVVYKDNFGAYDGVTPVGPPESVRFTFSSLADYKNVNRLKEELQKILLVRTEAEAIQRIIEHVIGEKAEKEGIDNDKQESNNELGSSAGGDGSANGG